VRRKPIITLGTGFGTKLESTKPAKRRSRRKTPGLEAAAQALRNARAFPSEGPELEIVAYDAGHARIRIRKTVLTATALGILGLLRADRYGK